MAGRPNDQAPQRANHEKQTEDIADESRYTNHYSAHEDNQSIEQLQGGHLSACQPLPGVGEYAKADAPDDKGSERAHDDQDHQRPEEADLLGHDHERGDFCAEKQQQPEKEHRPQGSRSVLETDRRLDSSRYHGAPCGLLADRSVDRLAQQVGVAGVTGSLLDEVQ